MKFTKIERHPLSNKFMLYCPVSWLSPFFGSYAECKEMQKNWEQRFAKEFAGLAEQRKNEVRKELEFAGL